ncbi:unnamed protein product [Cuscuta europaea]|uniref:GCK domain-containing protein n=1 Tax=Cuscuta europaea TaxID=41803 RepID=A0A9P1A0W0_CUSEU|nr:unnamed protein product [Cuscuta europaea]
MEDKKFSTANPNPSQQIAMSPSKSGQNEGNPESETSETQPPIVESSDPPREPNNQESKEDGTGAGENIGEGEREEDEEEGECGFCLFMKEGGCRDTFTDWEKCVEEGEKNKEDIVEKCFGVTSALKKCMEAHSDYYAPLLMAEKAAEAEALKELETEKEKEKEREESSEGNTKSTGEGESESSEKKES